MGGREINRATGSGPVCLSHCRLDGPIASSRAAQRAPIAGLRAINGIGTAQNSTAASA